MEIPEEWRSTRIGGCRRKPISGCFAREAAEDLSASRRPSRQQPRLVSRRAMRLRLGHPSVESGLLARRVIQQRADLVYNFLYDLIGSRFVNRDLSALVDVGQTCGVGSSESVARCHYAGAKRGWIGPAVTVRFGGPRLGNATQAWYCRAIDGSSHGIAQPGWVS